MLNALSILVGLFGLLLAIPAFLPFLGWANWLILPVPAVGVALGILSDRNTGRNLNLFVLAVALIRLALGGGIL